MTLKENEKNGNVYTDAYIDKNGKILIYSNYSLYGDFSEGLATAMDRRTEKWGFINQKGDEIIPFNYKEALSFKEGLSLVRIGNNPALFIDHSGEIVVPNYINDFYKKIKTK